MMREAMSANHMGGDEAKDQLKQQYEAIKQLNTEIKTESDKALLKPLALLLQISKKNALLALQAEKRRLGAGRISSPGLSGIQSSTFPKFEPFVVIRELIRGAFSKPVDSPTITEAKCLTLNSCVRIFKMTPRIVRQLSGFT